MSSIAFTHEVTDDGTLAIVAHVDASEYDSAQEYKLDYSISDPRIPRILHSGSVQFKQEEGASVCLEHAINPDKRGEKLEAAVIIFMRPGRNFKWTRKEDAKKIYHIFCGTDCLLPASLVLQTKYGLDPDSGKPFVWVSANAAVAARPGYTLERFGDAPITLNYSVSGGEPFPLTGEVDPDGLIQFEEQKLAYSAGAGAYFVLRLQCLVSQDEGLTLWVAHETDSRKYA